MLDRNFTLSLFEYKNLVLSSFLCVLSMELYAQPIKSIDLAHLPTSGGAIQRVFGSVGIGSHGVPVAGGFDMNSDGFKDYAFAAMQASPLDRTLAGQVFLILGNGEISGDIDTAINDSRVISFVGDQVQENAGSEIWMADVTGDGLGDLLICRQNYSPDSRIGAGALSIIPGQQNLVACAESNMPFDLRSPPACLNVTTIVGANAGDRLCMWARAGDVAGDSADDIVIGADREMHNGDEDAGAIYIIKGGAHLNVSGGILVDLANFGSTALPGNIARVRPVPSPFPLASPETDTLHYHFGATVQIADLDDNGKGEVIAAAALNRAGGVLAPLGGDGEGAGGSVAGTVYIMWDDNFTGDWVEAAPDFLVDEGPGALTIIDGGSDHDAFGEEILGGLDYDHDGNADLFIGDLTADGLAGVTRTNAGSGHVFYHAELLKGESFDFDGALPLGVELASFLGPMAGAISADTALHGDFNGDGIDDLAFSSPHDQPFDRANAGTLHIILGQDSVWPAVTDLALENFPTGAAIKIINVYGANGSTTGDTGDTLAYSGAAGDLNGDGADDLIVNEMVGNGVATGAVDVGNLILLDGRKITDLRSDDLCFPLQTSAGSVALICL